jgi:hypothetical protein
MKVFFPIQVKAFWFKKIIYCVVLCQIFKGQLQSGQSDCPQMFFKGSAKRLEQLPGIVDCKHSTKRVGLCKWYCYMWFALWVTNFMVTCHLEKLHLLPYKKELITIKKKHFTIKNRKLTHVTSKILPWKL